MVDSVESGFQVEVDCMEVRVAVLEFSEVLSHVEELCGGGPSGHETMLVWVVEVV